MDGALERSAQFQSSESLNDLQISTLEQNFWQYYRFNIQGTAAISTGIVFFTQLA